jgi:hypothetical protein
MGQPRLYPEQIPCGKRPLIRVLGKRALILVNQIFLLWRSCLVLCSTWNNLLSAIWL